MNTLAKRFIWVTFQRKGFHRYPSAPDDVKYLAQEHRHLFKFKVWISVTHNDRDIEFHQFLNWLESLYEGSLEMDYKSCEMLADELHAQIAARYRDRAVRIELSEDGECGCDIHYYPLTSQDSQNE